MSSRRKDLRKTVRVRLDQPLRVVMGSMGGEVRYDLQTRDISYTGFFLDFAKPGRFPFTPASIMEIWLELEPGNSIFFNGKMARVVYPADERAVETGPGIAVHIIQIDQKNESTLKEFIDRKLSNIEGDSGSVA